MYNAPLHKLKLSSFQVILLGFAAVILIGAFLLMLPISSKEGGVTPFSDALFTSTSAVCVTGLIVQDTATYWSYFGQAIILILIQIGGLGVVTVSILAGRKIGLGQRSTMQEAMSAPSVGGIGFLTWEDIYRHKWHIKKYRTQSKIILAMTGALIFIPTLYFFFCEFEGYAIGERILLSLFQAVTPRTAGFNTANLGLISEVGLLFMIFLMLVGGSPGSTAGGMKTTTLAVLFLLRRTRC